MADVTYDSCRWTEYTMTGLNNGNYPLIDNALIEGVQECQTEAKLTVCDIKEFCSEKIITLPILDTDRDRIPNREDLDDDNDGISDADEIKYGLNPLDPNDATADSDGDGYDNITEIEAGTNINSNNFTPKKLTNIEIKQIGEYKDKNYVSFVVENGIAYILSDNSLKILNVTDKNNITVLSTLGLDGYKYKIIKQNNYLYIANGDKGLRIIDIKDRKKPKLIGTFKEYSWTEDISIQGNLLYLACNGGGALNIVDITDKKSPKLIAKYGDMGMTVVEASQNYIYGDSFTGKQGISIVKLSDNRPVLIGKYNENSSSAHVTDIKVRGNYAYILINHVGVRIIDIRDKSKPKLVTTINIDDNNKALKIYAQYLFITSNNNSGTQIVDISNKSNPKILGKLFTYNGGGEVQIENNNLYVIGHYKGLKIFTTIPTLFNKKIIKDTDDITSKINLNKIDKQYQY